MGITNKKRAQNILNLGTNTINHDDKLVEIQKAQLGLMVDILEQLEFISVTLAEEIHNMRNR